MMNYRKKIIVYCCTIKQSWQVALYLCTFMPLGPSQYNLIRQYHLLVSRKRNLQTLFVFKEESSMFCVIIMVKFALELNAHLV